MQCDIFDFHCHVIIKLWAEVQVGILKQQKNIEHQSMTIIGSKLDIKHHRQHMKHLKMSCLSEYIHVYNIALMWFSHNFAGVKNRIMCLKKHQFSCDYCDLCGFMHYTGTVWNISNLCFSTPPLILNIWKVDLKAVDFSTKGNPQDPSLGIHRLLAWVNW